MQSTKSDKYSKAKTVVFKEVSSSESESDDDNDDKPRPLW